MAKPAAPIANLEFEQAVLGALLIRPQLFPDIASILTPESFYREAHGLIFRAIQDLHEQGQPVDVVLLNNLLRQRGQWEQIGGATFLAGLADNVGVSANADHYARLVQDKFLLRRLQVRALEIAEVCQRHHDTGERGVGDLCLYAESRIIDCLQAVEAAVVPAVLSGRELLAKDFSQATPVISNGLLPEGGGLMIAGESGEGKSLLALEMALHLCLGEDLWGLEIPRARRVLIVQFENTQQLDQVRLKRMLRGLRIDCPENIFFSGPEEPFDLADKTDQARLRALIQRQNPEVVIYDPLSCLHQENENDNAKMRRVMGQLTKISRRTATTAIVVHHYGKPGKEEIEGKYRVRGATSIRDWADTVLGYSYHKNEEDLILRNLDFLKIRHGAPLKPLILERDKETFLQRVSDGGTLCSPARVVTILMEKLGGEAEQKDLVMAIQRAVGCQESRARDFLNNAERYGYVVREIDPGDKRKKICRAVWKT